MPARVLAPLVAGSIAASIAEGAQLAWAAHRGGLASNIVIGAALEASGILLGALMAMVSIVALLARYGAPLFVRASSIAFVRRATELGSRLAAPNRRVVRYLIVLAIAGAAVAIARAIHLPREAAITSVAGVIGLGLGRVARVANVLLRANARTLLAGLFVLAAPSYPMLSRVSPLT